MSTKTIMIKSLCRFPQKDQEDELIFKPGVNVLVGPPNTGKTKWLTMLDYLMGDDDQPEDTFGADLANKYDAIAAVFTLGNEDITVERRWKEKGLKTKILMNGSAILASEFSQFLLEKLNIPVLHFPKGNPYSERAWPELSWRMMLRHVYRQERFWADLADKQPDIEQHACLMNFLGIAELLFPQQLGHIVEKRKNIFKLQARKEQFQTILQEISREVIADEAIAVAPTDESIDARIAFFRANIKELQQKRLGTLDILMKKNEQPNEGPPSIDINLGEQRVQLLSDKEDALALVEKTEKRISELINYYSLVQAELNRMARTHSAGKILADLKVTHCPVCDQEVKHSELVGDECYLCSRPYLDHEYSFKNVTNRIDFELEQLKEETMEIQNLIEKFSKEVTQLKDRIEQINSQVQHIDSLLLPIRVATASILPPEISIFDAETGRLEERIQQLERLKKALLLRKKLSKEIDELENEIEILEAGLEKFNEGINFEKANDLLSDGINTYLNALKAGDPTRWLEDAVQVKLKERGFNITVGNSKWSSKLGATLRCYFLMAYHYALLSLSNIVGCHYPGLCLIDFPPTLAGGSLVLVDDRENYLLEPFIDLLETKDKLNTQLIAVGRAFENLKGANRVELSKVWI